MFGLVWLPFCSDVGGMGERRVFKELSSDPGDLCRAYEEYVAALEEQLVSLVQS